MLRFGSASSLLVTSSIAEPSFVITATTPSVRARLLVGADRAEAATERFYLKRGDTGRPIVCVLEDSKGIAQDLTGAVVTFSMRLRGTTATKVDRVDAVILDPPTDGIVGYSWSDADVDAVGIYQAEFTVTFPSGKRVTYPSGAPPLDYNLVFVQDPASSTPI